MRTAPGHTSGIPLDFQHAEGGINTSGFLPESADYAARVAALADVDVDTRAHSALALQGSDQRLHEGPPCPAG
jgi:hypothetical protein